MAFVRGAYGDTTGSSTSNTLEVRLPAAIEAGDISWLTVSINSGAATLAPPAGWELVDGPRANGSVLLSWLFRRVMDGSGSDTLVTAQFSQSGRWVCSGLVVGDTAGQDSIVFAQDTQATTNLTVPTHTPVADDALAVLFVNGQRPSGSAGFTPPVGWTEATEENTTFGAGANFASIVSTRQLDGQAGVPQPGTTYAAWAAGNRNNQWVVTFAPAATESSAEWFQVVNGTAVDLELLGAIHEGALVPATVETVT